MTGLVLDVDGRPVLEVIIPLPAGRGDAGHDHLGKHRSTLGRVSTASRIVSTGPAALSPLLAGLGLQHSARLAVAGARRRRSHWPPATIGAAPSPSTSAARAAVSD